MKLNNLEFFLMNHPIRAVVQEIYEVRILRSIASVGNIDRALEIGCGNGTGAKLIREHFKTKQIDAIDLDEKMIALAKQRNTDPSVRYHVMDASNLGFPDNCFDAVFDFGIIHHIANWKACIAEIHRVLKTDGEAICEDLSIDTFRTLPGRLWKTLLEHPYEQMFSTTEFIEELARIGFVLVAFRESHPLGLLKHFSLVARKRNALVPIPPLSA